MVEKNYSDQQYLEEAGIDIGFYDVQLVIDGKKYLMDYGDDLEYCFEGLIGDFAIELSDITFKYLTNILLKNKYLFYDCTPKNLYYFMVSIYKNIKNYTKLKSLSHRIIQRSIFDFFRPYAEEYKNQTYKFIEIMLTYISSNNNGQMVIAKNENIRTYNTVLIFTRILFDLITMNKYVLSGIADKNKSIDFIDEIIDVFDYGFFNDPIECGLFKNQYAKIPTDPLVIAYVLKDLKQLVGFEIANIFSNKVEINRCENCGKFFIPLLRSDTKYCDRASPQDETKTCKEYGSTKLWYEKQQNDKALKLCRQIASAKQQLATRNTDISEYRIVYDNFRKESAQWKSDVKKGIKNSDEFIEWLQEAKKKKMKWWG